ncbi:tRNA 2-thiouridine(34) synthase MnmA [Candidatus Gracilibacteria bacterium]|nr:tRNA 2-thiouridine(34) synthase MnmA [Candidatus Gracilibacteria bacterium]MCF7898570.1 tRNA 2-thiouridine(34) synthase MnmA [Candidatus Paceibacterota bacterium]
MKKVYVGLSGGVDSSVSALLLKEQGYDVTGVFIKVWQPDFIECTWKEDRLDAMRVASLLDIPFITLDLEKEYKEGVIDYMIQEYKDGRTPNPDVMCNREVKFGAFYKWAKKQDKDACVATGHYAQIENNQLKKSVDENKDQTYFLWTLTSDILSSVIFPIGSIQKSEVRLLAEKFNLPVASKRDSQGLCFVGTIDIKTLLKNYIEEKTGEVKDEKGEVIGKHEGVMFYTIGERHGFVITKKGTDDAPYFVISKDFNSNTLIVSSLPPKEKQGGVISVTSTNFTSKIKKGEIYDVRARYRAPLSKVEVIDDNNVKVVEGDIVQAKGQSLVFYDGNICIGGGIII